MVSGRPEAPVGEVRAWTSPRQWEPLGGLAWEGPLAAVCREEPAIQEERLDPMQGFRGHAGGDRLDSLGAAGLQVASAVCQHRGHRQEWFAGCHVVCSR